jgi:hypothetical protein
MKIGSFQTFYEIIKFLSTSCAVRGKATKVESTTIEELSKTKNEYCNFDGFVKCPRIVMPDLIRHPEPIEVTGFRLSPE